MVDPTTPRRIHHQQGTADGNVGRAEGGKNFKNFMGRTPSFIKSKFLSVLGSSNDLLNGISNRLDISLSLSTSSDTETAAAENEYANRCGSGNRENFYDDESFDENIIDFESRKAKERRAHEELLSGKYRQPNFVAKINTSTDEYNIVDINVKTSSSYSNSNYTNSTTSPNLDSTGAAVADNKETNSVDNNMRDKNAESVKACSEQNVQNSNRLLQLLDPMKIEKTCSSRSTSENDLCIKSSVPSIGLSLESSDLNMWIRSESENSVPSWASSISLDSQTEEATMEFMRKFISVLFEDSASISLDIKSDFGLKARTETGRLWFARLVSAQRSKSKRVSETTFYSLIQYFAIILFESCEAEDFSPAKILMNMCFTFYHEVEVPGCEPYREYLYIYLREQPIWQSLRFWNAAFFDALQCERIHRPVPPNSNLLKSSANHSKSSQLQINDQSSIKSTTASTTSSSIATAAAAADNNRGDEVHELAEILKEDQIFQQNISFGQLGTFTCNMHAFGLSRELCTDFLRKQCVIANLNTDQEKMLRDNINRMYKETAKWRI